MEEDEESWVVVGEEVVEETISLVGIGEEVVSDGGFGEEVVSVGVSVEFNDCVDVLVTPGTTRHNHPTRIIDKRSITQVQHL